MNFLAVSYFINIKYSLSRFNVKTCAPRCPVPYCDISGGGHIMSPRVLGVDWGPLFSEELGQNSYRAASCGQSPLGHLGS